MIINVMVGTTPLVLVIYCDVLSDESEHNPVIASMAELHKFDSIFCFWGVGMRMEIFDLV